MRSSDMAQRVPDADQALGVPWVSAASRVLARSKQSDHSLVQDGEANVTYIRGKHTIDMSFSWMIPIVSFNFEFLLLSQNIIAWFATQSIILG